MLLHALLGSNSSLPLTIIDLPLFLAYKILITVIQAQIFIVVKKNFENQDEHHNFGLFDTIIRRKLEKTSINHYPISRSNYDIKY